MTGTIYGASTAKGWQLRLDYTVTADTAANRSTVTADLYVYDGTGRSYNQTPGEAWYEICGGGRNNAVFDFGETGWYALGSRTFTVDHNSDGTGSTTLSGDWCSGISDSAYTPYTLHIAGTVTLPAIPRASSVRSSSFTLGSVGTIVIEAASGAFTHTVTYAFGGVRETVISGTGAGTVYWAPPLSLAQQLPNSTSGVGTITCVTYSGSTVIGSAACSFTAYVPPSVVPSITTFSVEPVNTLQALAGAYAKGLTRASYSVAAAGAYGADIASCTVSLGDLSAAGLAGTTDLFTAAGTVTPVATVQDTRGRTAVKTLPPLTVYDYAAPTVASFSAQRCTAEGTSSDSGAYLHVTCQAACSPVGGRNSAAVRARYRAADGSFSGYTPFSGSVVIGGNLALNRSYVAEVSVTDVLGGVRTVAENISTAAVAVNVREGGKGMGVGKYAESDELLDVAWDACFHGKASVLGDLFAGGKKVQKTLMGGDFAGDMNTIREPGFYWCVQSCPNLPAADFAYVLMLQSAEGDPRLQAAFMWSGGFYYRMFMNGGWQGWIKV